MLEININSIATSHYCNTCIEGPADAKVKVKVIAGKVGDVKADVEKSTPLSYLHVWLPPKSSWQFPVPKDHNVLVYILKGTATFGNDKSKQATIENWVLFEQDGDIVQVNNADESQTLEYLFLEGKPYNVRIIRIV